MLLTNTPIFDPGKRGKRKGILGEASLINDRQIGY